MSELGLMTESESRQWAGSLAPAGVMPGRSARTTNILSYVHLRNIDRSTGAGRVARQLTEHLAMMPDVQMHLLVDRADQERTLPTVGGPWMHYKYHSFSADTSLQQARWFALDSPKAEDYWPEAEIVFCTAESYVPARRAKLAVTLHDAAFFENDAHNRDAAFWKQRMKWKLLYQKLSSKADLFHTVSEFSAARLSHFFPDIASRIRVVYNAAAPHFFGPAPSTASRYLGLRGLARSPYVLVPGGLHYRKNADLVLEACPLLARLYPGLVVVVVNHSDPAYVARAEALGLDIRLFGFVEEPALHALYTGAKVVWFPSRYEGFGLPVLEAMACGTPVVASNVASIPEIAGEAALLRDPSKAHDHVDAILSILTDSRAAEELARAGRAQAVKFTWQASAIKLKQCFDELL
jgi:glycosyltransferase involved in cell wall biosynthesis